MEDFEEHGFQEDETLAVGDVVYDSAALNAQAASASDGIPDAVRDFILYFRQCLVQGNVHELHACYETAWAKLTERFYRTSPWPAPAAVEPLVDGDEIFLILYTEAYYRHMYARLQPTVQDRIASYHNYCDLFNYILNPREDVINLELPTLWTWDIIDEFIYQFGTFSTYRTRALRRGASQAELAELRANSEVWGAYSVLNVLYSLAGKANMPAQLKAIRRGEDPLAVAGEFGTKTLYKNLGYFAIIGLLRVHTLLGDPALALTTMADIQLNKKALFARVTAAHFTTYYYVGFAYLMLRRYSDAVKAFGHALLFINRTKNINRSAAFDEVTKKSEQMYALLAVCVTLSPSRLDEPVHVGLRERYGEQLSKMARGGEEAFKTIEELFIFGAPRFISPTAPDFDAPPPASADPLVHHLRVFMLDVRSTLRGHALKSYLTLYSTMDTGKLAALMETTVEDLHSSLVTFKLKSRQIKWTEGELLDGQATRVSDIDIALENNLINIAETKGGRKFADWFIRNTVKSYIAEDYIANPKREKHRN